MQLVGVLGGALSEVPWRCIVGGAVGVHWRCSWGALEVQVGCAGGAVGVHWRCRWGVLEVLLGWVLFM